MRVAGGCLIIFTLKVPIGPVSDFYLYPRLQSYMINYLKNFTGLPAENGIASPLFTASS